MAVVPSSVEWQPHNNSYILGVVILSRYITQFEESGLNEVKLVSLLQDFLGPLICQSDAPRRRYGK